MSDFAQIHAMLAWVPNSGFQIDSFPYLIELKALIADGYGLAGAAAAAGIVVLGAATIFWRRRASLPQGETAGVAAAAVTGPVDDLAKIYDQYSASQTLRRGAVASASAGVASGRTMAPGGSADAKPAHGWLQVLDTSAIRLPLAGTAIRIGRHISNDVVLDNQTIHRQHAVLHLNQKKRFEIEDLGGENGVIVNGTRSTKQVLEHNDVIELGDVKLRILYPESSTG